MSMKISYFRNTMILKIKKKQKMGPENKKRGKAFKKYIFI